jgi:mannose-6-phosphate isomerase-like protein (cupin superfamily)
MTDMTLGADTVDLTTEQLVFDPHGTVRAERGRTATDDPDWRLAIVRVETDDDVHADHWERHTLGDEAVACLRGGLRLHLRADRPGAPDDVVRLPPGRGVVVPRGRWHRIELDEPSDLMVTTIRRGTELERRA